YMPYRRDGVFSLWFPISDCASFFVKSFIISLPIPIPPARLTAVDIASMPQSSSDWLAGSNGSYLSVAKLCFMDFHKEERSCDSNSAAALRSFCSLGVEGCQRVAGETI